MGNLFTNEQANLEKDISAAYGWLQANWKRVLAWYAGYYATTHYGPAVAGKAQAILKVLGM